MAQIESSQSNGHGFGVAPVFLSGVCTIFGAILFLRFGYAVAHVGLTGTILIIIIGHLITIPTALAVSEIATNQRVEGGGEYYIISRSFGTTIGGTIGIALYLSQAASIAFYMIAFAEAFRPVFAWVNSQGWFPFALENTRIISLPATVLLVAFMMKKGAGMGVKILWGVAAILAASLLCFAFGTGTGNATGQLTRTIANPHSFAVVFAICFPAFTGMTAGVGLSGDLKDPKRSIPVGTIAATLVGMVGYIFIAFKLWSSASPEELGSDPLIMSRIAAWGPAIPIGLAAATLSSAIGSILVAPRTLQALADDATLPSEKINTLLAEGRGDVNEPYNATLFSGAIALVIVALGDVDIVAQVISMFFMVTYGSLCGISFLEHFAGNPSYRPAFKTRWFISLFGAFMCFMMMFQMSPFYAILSIAIMHGIYLWLQYSRNQGRDLTAIFQGVVFQLTRHLHVAAQKRYAFFQAKDWRPSFIMISSETFERLSAFDFMRWISHQYGFGTIIHHIPGEVSAEKNVESRRALTRLIRLTEAGEASVFVDTVVAPDYDTALGQMIQVAGVSGLENNSILFEFPDGDAQRASHVAKACGLVSGLGFNICVLRSSDRRFGFKRQLHVWLTTADSINANLMILLAYIIEGHPEWDDSEISVFAALPSSAEAKREQAKLTEQVREGRLPISPKRVHVFTLGDEGFDPLVERLSGQADMTFVGLDLDLSAKEKETAFSRFPGIKDLLFVSAAYEIKIG